MSGERHLMFVRIRKDVAEPKSKHRVYVHEIVLQKSVENEEASPFKTGSDPEIFRGKKSGGTSFYLSLARRALAVNPSPRSCRRLSKSGRALLILKAGWFETAHGGKAENPEIGTVKRSVKDSWSHGHERFKASAFAAVPDVVSKGRIIDRQSNWKGRGYDTVVIAAPIKLGQEDRVMTVIVEKRENNRFYLHEAYLKENLQKSLSFKTGASQTSGASTGDIENLARSIFSVNPETASRKPSPRSWTRTANRWWFIMVPTINLTLLKKTMRHMSIFSRQPWSNPKP